MSHLLLDYPDYCSSYATHIDNAMFGQLEGAFTTEACISMYRNVCNPHINRSQWTEAEDNALKELVDQHGHQNWPLIAEQLGVSCLYAASQFNSTMLHPTASNRILSQTECQWDWLYFQKLVLQALIRKVTETIYYIETQFLLRSEYLHVSIPSTVQSHLLFCRRVDRHSYACKGINRS